MQHIWDYVNNYDRANHVFLANDMITDSAPPNNQNTLMPWPYLFEVLRQMETFFSVKMIGNILSNADYQRIIISALKLLIKGGTGIIARFRRPRHPTPFMLQRQICHCLIGLNLMFIDATEDEDADNCWDGFKYEIKQKGYYIIKGTLNGRLTVLDPGVDHVVLRISQYASAENYFNNRLQHNRKFCIEHRCIYFAAAAGIGEYIVFTLVVENNNVPRVVDGVTELLKFRTQAHRL
jgi:hypothetical protein